MSVAKEQTEPTSLESYPEAIRPYIDHYWTKIYYAIGSDSIDSKIGQLFLDYQHDGDDFLGQAPPPHNIPSVGELIRLQMAECSFLKLAHGLMNNKLINLLLKHGANPDENIIHHPDYRFPLSHLEYQAAQPNMDYNIVVTLLKYANPTYMESNLRDRLYQFLEQEVKDIKALQTFIHTGQKPKGWKPFTP
jgi:hypothetical protein